MEQWYKISNAEFIDSPALLVSAEGIRENIAAAVKMSAGPDWFRPHVKTHKMEEVTKLMLSAGIYKFKCATIAEAEMLALSGAGDILLAYQPSAVKARRLSRLSAKFPDVRFSCLADNLGTLQLLSGVFGEQVLDIYIDLNLGMNRTGIPPAGAPALYEQGSALKNLRIKGLHGYDGHIHDKDPEERRQRALAGLQQVLAVKEQIETFSDAPLRIVMGGTPTFPVHAKQKGVETSPGTFVFWDAGYGEIMPEAPFRCAAVLMSRVVSIVDKHLLCLDLGHKSVAAENPIQHRVVFPDRQEAGPLSQSEEHLVVQVPDTTIYEPGNIWYGIPWHICPTIALYDEVYLIEDGEYRDKWKVTARDRQITM